MHRCMCISNKLRILEFGADVNLTTGVRLQQLRDRIQLLTQNHILKSRKAMMWTWSLQPASFLLSAVQALMQNDHVLCGSKEEPRPAGMSRRILWAEQVPEAGSDLLLKGREVARASADKRLLLDQSDFRRTSRAVLRARVGWTRFDSWLPYLSSTCSWKNICFSPSLQ